jgi:uncharacterized protein
MMKVLFLLLFLYLTATLMLFIKQRDLLYFPTPEADSKQAEAIWLNSPQQRMKLWKIHQQSHAIIYFGGNAEAIENNIARFDQALPEHTVYLANYRGFGGSSGSASEKALFEDALAIYDALSTQYQSISVIGRSLGSGVAIYLATQRKIDKLALVTPYDSVINVAQSHYPIFPVRWLLKDRFDSLSRASLLTQPVLVLLAEKDGTVPRKHSEALIRALDPAKTKVSVIMGSGHGSISSFDEYLDNLSKFFSRSNSGEAITAE